MNLPTKTYEIIKPMWEITDDGAKTISSWHVCATTETSYTMEEALQFGRLQYGADVDIRLVEHSVKA